ncbi:MAG: hypothetical protein GXZ07_06910 [Firmicutes bacterium]|nr:hypothetical protein [Bacillota bacterium]
MPWLIFAVLVWIIVLFIVRIKELGRLWSAGFWSIIVSYYLNTLLTGKGFYQFQETFLTYHGIPFLYLAALGGIAIIIMRFLPQEKFWQLPYLILFSAGLTGLDFFAQSRNYLLFLQWSLLDNFLFKVFTIITIVWLSNLTIKQQERRYYF